MASAKAKIRHVFGDTFSCRAAPPDILVELSGVSPLYIITLWLSVSYLRLRHITWSHRHTPRVPGLPMKIQEKQTLILTVLYFTSSLIFSYRVIVPLKQRDKSFKGRN